MAEIVPFRGVLYDGKKVGVLSQVVAPPYDVIPAQEEDELHRRHQYNVIRLIRGQESAGEGEDRYNRAAAYLQDWLRKGVLRKDEKSAIYIYEQNFLHKGRKMRRDGFIALGRLENHNQGSILPHERTLTRPREDRLRLLRACRANLSPIFALYSDPKGRIDMNTDSQPIINIEDHMGQRHRLWRIRKKSWIDHLKEEMALRRIFIADGHHRYEAALMFRKEMEGCGNQHCRYGYCLLYLSRMEDEGLLILPAHRLIARKMSQGVLKEVKNYFLMEDFPFQPGGEEKARRKFLSVLMEERKGNHLFGMYHREMAKYSLLRLKENLNLHELILGEASLAWKKLDVTILHSLILSRILNLKEEDLSYVTDEEAAIREVREGRSELAFLLRPTTVAEVKAVAEKGERMPGKATHFYPKLLSGLVINLLEE